MRNASRGPKIIKTKLANLCPQKRERQNRKPARGIASATMKTIGSGKTSIAISELSRSGVSVQNTMPAPRTVQTARNHSLRNTAVSQKRNPTQKAAKPTVETTTFRNSDNDKSYPCVRSQYWPYFC